MPYGLFDYENVIEPMGLSPQALPLPTFPKVPQQIPSNTSIVTRAIPENAGVPATAQKFAYMGAENSPPQKVTTMAIPEDGVIPAPVTDACIPSEGCTPNPPPITLRMPENPATPTPTPPSGGCPAGYSSAGSSPIPAPVEGGAFNQTNPYGLTAGQYITGASTGKPFNVNQAGTTWIPTGNTSMPVRAPVSATAPNTWSGTQQQYTSMLSQLGLASAR